MKKAQAERYLVTFTEVQNKEIGRRLKKLRESQPKADRPARVAGEVLGISTSYIYSLETGRKQWSLEKVVALCILYGADVSEILKPTRKGR